MTPRDRSSSSSAERVSSPDGAAAALKAKWRFEIRDKLSVARLTKRAHVLQQCEDFLVDYMARELEAALAALPEARRQEPHMKPSGEQRMDQLVATLTQACREADEDFERVGGSSRHWVRDCFLPALAKHHLSISDGEAMTSCGHCGVDLRPSEWMDRETGLTCARGANKGQPHSPIALPEPQEPT